MKISARKLLSYNTEELWTRLKGNFTLVFDDGTEIQTNSRETIYSHFIWVFHKRYPKLPLLKNHHVSSIINSDDRLSSNTHIKLFANVMWDCYYYEFSSWQMQQETQSLVNQLSLLVYQTSNLMYNELSTKLEFTVVSLDITDFIQILEYPEIKTVLEDVSYDQAYIDRSYKTIENALNKNKALALNPISKAVKAKLVKKNQVLQCLGPRGYLTDIDSHIFPKPIVRGYVRGIRKLHDSIIESRSVAKSLYFAKSDLQDTEYFSRRLQLLCQIVENLHYGDCGSTSYLTWFVKPKKVENGSVVEKGDLKSLIGKYYLDEQTNSLKAISGKDTHLEGKYVRLRSVVAGCAHPDPYGVCSVCYGELSLSIPKNTNLGQINGSSIAQRLSQSILSVKHLDGSSQVESIDLSPDERRYLSVSDTGDGYLLSEDLLVNNVKLVFSPKEAEGITDIREVDDVKTLGISRISELTTITLIVTTKEHQEKIPILVGRGKRKANFTYDMLDYIKQVGWSIDEKDNYVVNLNVWDRSKALMTLPAVHFNMSDAAKEIATMIESKKENVHKNVHKQQPEMVLLNLFDLIKKHVDVNLAVVEITIFGAMIRSMRDKDYRLPKTFTNRSLGVSKLSIKGRSLSGAMAYEEQNKILLDPTSFVKENRPSHIMDVFLCPREAVAYSES